MSNFSFHVVFVCKSHQAANVTERTGDSVVAATHTAFSSHLTSATPAHMDSVKSGKRGNDSSRTVLTRHILILHPNHDAGLMWI